MVLKRHQGAEPAPIIDRYYGHNGAREAVGALEEGRWELAQRVVESEPDAHGRELVVEVLSSELSRAAVLDDWVESAGGTSSVPWLVRGAYVARKGWFGRADSGFATVIGEAAGSDPVIASLAAAEDDLWKAAEMDADDPVPWTFLLLTGRALQLDVHELVRRFEEADKREKHLGFAHDQLLQGLSPRWHTDGELLFSFATLVSSEAPEGSPVHRVIPRAHLEYYWGLHENPRQQEVYGEALEVLDALNQAAAKSVDSMMYGDGPHALITRNVFALAYNIFGDKARAHAQFKAIGDHATPDPWDTFGDGAEGAFIRQRNVAAGVT